MVTLNWHYCTDYAKTHPEEVVFLDKPVFHFVTDPINTQVEIKAIKAIGEIMYAFALDGKGGVVVLFSPQPFTEGRSVTSTDFYYCPDFAGTIPVFL